MSNHVKKQFHYVKKIKGIVHITKKEISYNHRRSYIHLPCCWIQNCLNEKEEIDVCSYPITT